MSANPSTAGLTLPPARLSRLTELTSQIFRVLSSDADTSRLESEDHATSEMPCGCRTKRHEPSFEDKPAQTESPVLLTSLCPEMVFSNFPSYAPQIFMSLSAAAADTETQSGLFGKQP